MASPTPKISPSDPTYQPRATATAKPAAPTIRADMTVRRSSRGSVVTGRFSSTDNGFLKETPDQLYNAHHGGDRPQHYPEKQTPRRGGQPAVDPQSNDDAHPDAGRDGGAHHGEGSHARQVRKP